MVLCPVVREKSPRRNVGVRREQINFESRGTGGFFHAPTGLNNIRFTITCNILPSLRLYPRWRDVQHIGIKGHPLV